MANIGGSIEHMYHVNGLESAEECAILFLDKKGNIRNWNLDAEHMRGFGTDDLIGQNYRVLFTDEDQVNKIPEKLIDDARLHGKVYYKGWRTRTDGSVFWADIIVTALYDTAKNIIGFTKVMHDTTALKNIVEFEESNLNALINNLTDELWSVDRTYKLITANKAFNDLMIKLSGAGVQKGDDLTATKFAKKQIDSFRSYYDRAFSGESFTIDEYTHSPVDYWSVINFSPIYNGDTIIGAACHSRNVTTEKKALFKQQQHDRRFRNLIEHSMEGVAILTQTGTLDFVSPSAENLLGYPAAELIGRDYYSLIHPEHKESEKADIRQSVSHPGKMIRSREIRMKHRDGSWKWIEGLKTNKLADDSINGIVLNFRDVTAHFETLKKLEANEARLRQAQSVARFGGCELDLASGLATWSDEHCRIFGIDAKDNVQSYSSWMSFIHPDDFRKVLITISEAESTGSDLDFTYRIVRHDKSVRHIHSIAHFVFGADGKPATLNGVVKDVTEQKESAEKLLYANRLLTFKSEINKLIAQNTDEISLLTEACHLAVNYGKFEVAWINKPDRKNKRVNFIAQSDSSPFEIAFFKNLVNFEDDGPTGSALSTGRPNVINDFSKVKNGTPRKLYADAKGFKSAIALPISKSGSILYTLNLFSLEPDFFCEDEVALLEEATKDISFALDFLEKEKQRQEAETNLKINERKFRSLIENSADAIAIFSPQGEMLYMSPSVDRVLGFTDVEMMEIDLTKIIHPDALPMREPFMAEVLANPGKPIGGFVKQMKHKDGTWRWIESTMTNMLDDPAVGAVVDNFRDVTERIVSERKLQHSKNRLKHAQEIAHTGSWEMNLESRVISWSEEMSRIFGIDEDISELSYEEWLAFAHPDDVDHLLGQIAEARRSFSDASINYRIIRKNGQVRHLHLLSHYDQEVPGSPRSIYGALQDVTEIKTAEEKIKESEHRFRTLIEHSMGGVGILSDSGKTIYVAPSISSVLGYSAEEFMELDIFTLMHPDDLAPAGAVIERALQNPGQVIQGHTGRMKHKDGSWKWLDAVVTNLLHDPAIKGLVNNFRDVTGRKHAEEKLVMANRLFAFTSALNHTIVHTTNEADLFREACRIATEIGGFSMAWIGVLDEWSGRITPVVSAGTHCSYVDGIFVSSDINLGEGRGPIGMAVRENRSVICNDIEKNDSILPWKERMLKYGFRSVISMPLNKGGKVIGVLTMYSSTVGFFDNDEIRLLESAAFDLSFALDIFEKEILRNKLSKKLKQNELLLLRAQEVANFGSYEAEFATRMGVWSEQFCHIYGISPANNIQSFDNWVTFLHPDDRGRVLEILEESDTKGKNVNFNYRIIRQDGTQRHIYSYRQIEFNGQGIPVGAFVVAHDITDEIEHIAQLELQDKTLSEIAWLQSHKVRAPLANILGLTQLVDVEKVDQETCDLIRGIQASSEKLDLVIREIVDKSYIPGFVTRNPYRIE